MNYEDYIGSVGLTAATFAPNHTALCQGQLVSVSQNTALFSILGVAYGGDGRVTFGLPDLRGTVPVGTGSSPTTGATYERGDELAVLNPQEWPQGWPARAAEGQTTTVPTPVGPSGLALNWAITLYGYFPPRD